MSRSDELRHHDEVVGARGRFVAVAGAALAAGSAAIALATVRGSVPYLDPVRALALPAVALVCAVAASYVALCSPRRSTALPLLVVSFASSAGPLSWVLAQRSPAWVALGAVPGLLGPGAAWLVLTITRVPGTGGLGRAAVGTGLGLCVVTVLAEATLTDPGGWGWCRCQPNPLVLVSEGTYAAWQPWLDGARITGAALALVGAATATVTRPGRRGASAAGSLLGLAGVGVGLAVAEHRVLALALLLILLVTARETLLHRPSRAHVADLLLEARERRDPARLEELVARALGDPAATVWWCRPGEPEPAAAHLPPTRVLRVNGSRPIALVIAGSRDLTTDVPTLEAVAEALRLTTENRLLSDELSESLEQVRQSRARIVAAADETRQQIERDLHDGTQQLLISTGVKLNLATARLAGTGDREVTQTLADASDELGRALAELRQLARGITPTVLVHGSLTDALEELAMRCPVPVAVNVSGSRAPGRSASVTAYFVAAECLTNVAKHAEASGVTVTVAQEDPLRLRIEDDGRGGADLSAGSGLRGLVDRVEAAGGRLLVESDARGTRVTASIPLKGAS